MKSKPVLFLIMFLAFGFTNAKEEYSISFNANCRAAYENFMAMRFKDGEKYLEQERKSNPKNGVVYFIENIPDVIKCFITEDDAVFESLKKNRERRINILEKTDGNSPYHRLMLAESHLFWAIARIKYGEYITAAIEINKAYRLLSENKKKHPGFKLNDKSLGLLHFLIGTMPDSYKYITNILGIRGTVKQGLNELRGFYRLTSNNKEFEIYQTEAMLYLGMVLINYTPYEQEALNLMAEIDKIRQPNPLLLYTYASIGLKSGKSDQVINLFQNAMPGPEYYVFPYLYLQYGEAKLNRLDEDAWIWIYKFLHNFNGKNYIKAANQRLFWYHLLNSNEDKANFYFKEINLHGELIVDEDKQAQRNFKNNHKPLPGLLKARVLYDGGYYKRAFAALTTMDPKEFTYLHHQLEYLYRLARVQQKMGQENLAIINYEKAFKLGEGHPYYFSSSSALQLGLINEAKGDKEAAKKYFQKVLSSDKHDFKNSIDQKAKAGLSRLNDN
jgi:hypothetical protein